jgi:hypothetical protein
MHYNIIAMLFLQFWAGPFAGSMLAALSYEFIFKAPASTSSTPSNTTGYTGVGQPTGNEILDDIAIERTISQQDGRSSAEPAEIAINDAYFPVSPGRASVSTSLLPGGKPRPGPPASVELSSMPNNRGVFGNRPPAPPRSQPEDANRVPGAAHEWR